jgi:hypothetical protein
LTTDSVMWLWHWRIPNELAGNHELVRRLRSVNGNYAEFLFSTAARWSLTMVKVSPSQHFPRTHTVLPSHHLQLKLATPILPSPETSSCDHTATPMATSIRPHTASRSQIALSPTRPQTAHSTIRRVTPSPDSSTDAPNGGREPAQSPSQRGSPHRPVSTSALGYVLDGEPATQWMAGEYRHTRHCGPTGKRE